MTFPCKSGDLLWGIDSKNQIKTFLVLDVAELNTNKRDLYKVKILNDTGVVRWSLFIYFHTTFEAAKKELEKISGYS